MKCSRHKTQKRLAERLRGEKPVNGGNINWLRDTGLLNRTSLLKRKYKVMGLKYKIILL